jgi:TolB-like protein
MVVPVNDQSRASRLCARIPNFADCVGQAVQSPGFRIEVTSVARGPADVRAGGSDEEPPGARRLDSWKEIAAYLKRDTATVRRWEKREALPVHRHHHDKLGSVYAYASELDVWWEGRRQRVEQTQPAEPDRRAGRRVAVGAALVSMTLAVVVSAYVSLGRRTTSTNAGWVVRSLAVLPFQPLGGDVHDETLELGMADALITRLSNLDQIQVRSMSAVLPYAKSRRAPDAAGRELGVDAVVEGKIQRADNRIRITVQLLRVRDGASLWAGTFDEQFTNIFTVQDSISHQVARALPLTLSSEEAKRLTSQETRNPQAYQLYLNGRYFLSKGVGDELREAADLFEQAIRLDPNYALAYAGLADSFASWANSTILPSKDAYLKARAAALKALELDGTLAGAHATLGAVNLFYDWDWPAAERAFRRAIALDPDDVSAHRRYALGLMWLGRFDEAIREIHRARELAPVDRETNANLALVLYFARRYDEAIVEARRTLEMDRGFSQAHRTIARTFVEQRLYDQAIVEFHEAIASGGIQLLKAELGHAYAVSGQRKEALKILHELNDVAKQRYVSPYDMAILHTGLGDRDQAFAWLEKSFAERERWMLQLKVAPFLDPIRSDPRFADLVQRVGVWR